ncbi:MAG: MGMT family protein [bacterium]|nr:MGMT family protein [bacterium]
MEKNIFELVWEEVKKIPKGKVVTYGEIARRLKMEDGKLKIDARMVGWALHANRSSAVPCHRVVDRNGRLAPGFAFDGPKEQRRRLEAEGVGFTDEGRVDLLENRHTRLTRVYSSR